MTPGTKTKSRAERQAIFEKQIAKKKNKAK